MKFVNKILDIFLIYNRDPALLINVKLSLVEREENETKVFNEEIFESILTSATSIQGEIHGSAISNIRKVHDEQKKDFDRHHLSNCKIKMRDLILLRNSKRRDRKGWKFSFAWLGHYIVSEITLNGVTTLKIQDGEILKLK